MYTHIGYLMPSPDNIGGAHSFGLNVLDLVSRPMTKSYSFGFKFNFWVNELVILLIEIK